MTGGHFTRQSPVTAGRDLVDRVLPQPLRIVEILLTRAQPIDLLTVASTSRRARLCSIAVRLEASPVDFAQKQ